MPALTCGARDSGSRWSLTIRAKRGLPPGDAKRAPSITAVVCRETRMSLSHSGTVWLPRRREAGSYGPAPATPSPAAALELLSSSGSILRAGCPDPSPARPGRL
jgi:hypothetical protein